MRLFYLPYSYYNPPMSSPKLTVSGYRGIWGETLTVDIAQDLAHAFASFVIARGGKRILLGRDARQSGPTIIDAVAETLSARGLDVTIGGLLPTPTVLFLVREEKFDGAIIVTASHNPTEYNGLKFVTSRGMFTNETDVAEIKNYLEEKNYAHSENVGNIETNESLGEKHIAHILKHIDVERIQNKKFKVVLDPINSAGSILTPILLEKLGCETTVINGRPDGNFAHMPEPLAVNLTTLGDAVRTTHADVGFAQDPDADRLVLADETGSVVFEEYTLALAVQSVLEKTPGDIVINLSTSKTSEMIAEKFGKKTFRSKVGESNVVEEIIKRNAVIGGEGSGGIIYPAINPCRDSLTGIAIILELLAKENKSLGTLVAELPHFEMMKDKFPFAGDLSVVYEKIKMRFPDAMQDTQDGLRLDFEDMSWVNIRPSNTEPIVRIMGEAKMKERIQNLVTDLKACLL